MPRQPQQTTFRGMLKRSMPKFKRFVDIKFTETPLFKAALKEQQRKTQPELFKKGDDPDGI